MMGLMDDMMGFRWRLSGWIAEKISADAEISASKSVRGTEGTSKFILIRNPEADLKTLEIKRYRDGAWEAIASRRHTISLVYAHDAKGTDLMLVAVNTTGLKNGRTVTGEFTARIIVDQHSLDRGQPRLRYVQVWAVYALMTSPPSFP
jgi:hypothetical protein